MSALLPKATKKADIYAGELRCRSYPKNAAPSLVSPVKDYPAQSVHDRAKLILKDHKVQNEDQWEQHQEPFSHRNLQGLRRDSKYLW